VNARNVLRFSVGDRVAWHGSYPERRRPGVIIAFEDVALTRSTIGWNGPGYRVRWDDDGSDDYIPDWTERLRRAP
jgi:hypothetical protein